MAQALSSGSHLSFPRAQWASPGLAALGLAARGCFASCSDEKLGKEVRSELRPCHCAQAGRPKGACVTGMPVETRDIEWCPEQQGGLVEGSLLMYAPASHEASGRITHVPQMGFTWLPGAMDGISEQAHTCPGAASLTHLSRAPRAPGTPDQELLEWLWGQALYSPAVLTQSCARRWKGTSCCGRMVCTSQCPSTLWF